MRRIRQKVENRRGAYAIKNRASEIDQLKSGTPYAREKKKRNPTDGQNQLKKKKKVVAVGPREKVGSIRCQKSRREKEGNSKEKGISETRRALCETGQEKEKSSPKKLKRSGDQMP